MINHIIQTIKQDKHRIITSVDFIIIHGLYIPEYNYGLLWGTNQNTISDNCIKIYYKSKRVLFINVCQCFINGRYIKID